MKKIISVLLCAMLLISTCLCAVSCNSNDQQTTKAKAPDTPQEPTDAEKYADALALIASGNYAEAKAIFEALGDYEDAKVYASRFRYFPTRVDYNLSDLQGRLIINLGENNLPTILDSSNNVADKTFEIFYDENGRVIKETSTLSTGEVDTIEYTYNADGNYQTVTRTYVDGAIDLTSYIYDEDGRLIGQSFETTDGYYETTSYTYDENGNVIQDYILVLGEYEVVYDYTLDENGNLITTVYTDSDGLTATTEFTRDENGNLLRETYTEGDYQRTFDFTYDENGNVIKEEKNTSDGKYAFCVNSYDENGNMISQVYTDYDGSQETIYTQFVLVYVPIDISERTYQFILYLLDVNG